MEDGSRAWSGGVGGIQFLCCHFYHMLALTASWGSPPTAKSFWRPDKAESSRQHRVGEASPSRTHPGHACCLVSGEQRTEGIVRGRGGRPTHQEGLGVISSLGKTGVSSAQPRVSVAGTAALWAAPGEGAQELCSVGGRPGPPPVREAEQPSARSWV